MGLEPIFEVFSPFRSLLGGERWLHLQSEHPTALAEEHHDLVEEKGVSFITLENQRLYGRKVTCLAGSGNYAPSPRLQFVW